MKLYSDLEIDLLIDELTEAALEAIEQAAGEAARATVLAMLESEAEALREAQYWKNEAGTSTRKGFRNLIFAGAACLASGLMVGIFIK
jgi:hypothetical protein